MIYGHEIDRGWSTGGVIVGVAVGAVIGAGLGVLLAPRRVDNTVPFRPRPDRPSDAASSMDRKVPVGALQEVPSL